MWETLSRPYFRGLLFLFSFSWQLNERWLLSWAKRSRSWVIVPLNSRDERTHKEIKGTSFYYTMQSDGVVGSMAGKMFLSCGETVKHGLYPQRRGRGAWSIMTVLVSLASL